MPRLPDRFDLWLRRAKSFPDPERQLDFVLGALVNLPDWYFLNLGTAQNPQPATSEIEGTRALLVFSDAARVAEVEDQMKLPGETPDSRLIAIPAALALTWFVEQRPGRCDTLLINPGEEAALIPLDRAASFARAWQARDPGSSGFWIPHPTGAEEAFWQEHGL
jgi:hypothetical protein